MTTTTTAATAARPILALDPGKYKSVACLSTGAPAPATFADLPQMKASWGLGCDSRG
jgi:hypothetical protein